ncbi:hypothetical protein [Calothrix sp. PCC 6303]|uniref:hypothetical protein n=1 Tax=Calothrix sp. PCC 6303 TaxID=1170562 RepID=UPI0002A00942|nr:hypothetical protein [Calothrix sp. PCC 6303]AFZ03482.1 hypothetical protein Cal6303_4582 [Calothrix sp. PCC 6303]
MPNHRYPPASIRYLKAKLWNLTRPAVWGTAIFLSVAGLVAREYFVNPNFLSRQSEEPKADVIEKPSNDISSEDKAIAADIDNLPVLISDAEKAALATANSPVLKGNSTEKRKNPLDEAIKNQKTSSSTPQNLETTVTSEPENQFITEANDLLKFSNPTSQTKQTNSLNQPDKNFNNQSPNQTSTTPDALKTAIEKSNSPAVTSNPTNNLGQNSSTSSLPNQSLPNNGVNSTPQNNSYQSNTVPQTQTYSTYPNSNISNNFSNSTSSAAVTSTSNSPVPTQSSGFAAPNGSTNTSGYGNSTLPQQSQPQQYNAYPNSQRLPGQ